MADPRCPFCAQPIATGAELTRDHIFVDALGGHQTVPACRTCNSQIGRDIEGALMRPDGLLNLIRQTGGDGNAIPGTVGPEATPITHELATDEMSFQKPVSTSSDGQTRQIEFSGSPDQVRQLLRGQRISSSQANELLANAAPGHFDGPITVAFSVDSRLLHRLAAKIALAALAFVDPEASFDTDLATGLRDVLWARSLAAESPGSELLEQNDEMARRLTEVHDRPPVVELVPPAGTSQVVFLPAHGIGCVVLVHLAGFDIPGIVVRTAQLPYDDVALLVRDAVGSALVSRLGAALEDALAELGD